MKKQILLNSHPLIRLRPRKKQLLDFSSLQMYKSDIIVSLQGTEEEQSLLVEESERHGDILQVFVYSDI